MIFIVRTLGDARPELDLNVVLVRRTPSLVADDEGQVDLFCVADTGPPEHLRGHGWRIVALHDGWYQDDRQGGVAVWGQGRYWEIRQTPFDVRQRGG